MTESQPSTDPSARVAQALDVTIRIGMVLALTVWSLMIVRPFAMAIVWGVVLAVAIHPVHVRLRALLGGRSGASATALALLSLAVLVVPSVALTSTLVDFVMGVGTDFAEGTLVIPPPPERILEWPLVGEPITEFWKLANQNLEGALLKAQPQLEAASTWLLEAAAGAGGGLLQFVISVVLMGAFLARDEDGARIARAISTRLVDARGPQLVELARATVRSVARGVLGVAMIQALLAGLGFLALGIPGAGLWALLVLLLAVVQLPPALILIPVALYAFSVETAWVAVIFAIWNVAIALMDNVLKPILMGRGVEVPMLVIFVGVIGGFLSFGIIGLFLGAVVLAIAYQLVRAWLGDSLELEPD
jgi:predicted PurR-regulated permease PerM